MVQFIAHTAKYSETGLFQSRFCRRSSVEVTIYWRSDRNNILRVLYATMPGLDFRDTIGHVLPLTEQFTGHEKQATPFGYTSDKTEVHLVKPCPAVRLGPAFQCISCEGTRGSPRQTARRRCQGHGQASGPGGRREIPASRGEGHGLPRGLRSSDTRKQGDRGYRDGHLVCRRITTAVRTTAERAEEKQTGQRKKKFNTFTHWTGIAGRAAPESCTSNTV